MKPLFTAAKLGPKRRVVYAEGEDERVLRAVQGVVDEGLASPIVIGRPSVVERRIERYGLRIKPGVDFELVNPEWDERYRSFWSRGLGDVYKRQPLSARATRRPHKRCAMRSHCSPSAHRTSRSMARCTVMPRCPQNCE